MQNYGDMHLIQALKRPVYLLSQRTIVILAVIILQRNVIGNSQIQTVIESTTILVTKELYWPLNSQEIYSDI